MQSFIGLSLYVFLLVRFGIPLARAVPMPIDPVDIEVAKRAVTPVSTSEIRSFTTIANFAAVAYCDTDKIRNWSCGEFCNANSDFTPSLVGGNGNDVQQHFVGYLPSQNSIIVVYQGTDPLKFQSVLTDLDLHLDPLPANLFPGTPSGAKVHSGFLESYEDAASAVLAKVKQLMSQHGTKKITLTGHSLGGAIAQLASVSFKLQMPDADVRVVTFGAPRAGNPEWAQFVGQKISNYKRVNNRSDLIPILPGRSFGYQHPRGEIHLLGSGSAVACSGYDSTEPQCQIDTVPNILLGNIFDHLGSYEGIYMGTIFC